MKGKKIHYASIDEYIASFPEDVRKTLAELRETIKAAAPDAKEAISYNLPTFTLDGRYLIYFAAWKKHISIYPVPSGSKAFNHEVAKYVEGSGTLKFPLGQPIPMELISNVVKYALADNQRRTGKKKE